MVHTVYFFVCKLSARPQFSIFPFSTFNFKKLSLGHNMFFYVTNCLHEQGTAARRITNKKVVNRNFALKICYPTLIFNL